MLFSSQKKIVRDNTGKKINLYGVYTMQVLIECNAIGSCHGFNRNMRFLILQTLSFKKIRKTLPFDTFKFFFIFLYKYPI
jgi:hypothetical protein